MKKGLLGAGFACAAVAGFVGAMLNKYAPVRGGNEVVVLSFPPFMDLLQGN